MSLTFFVPGVPISQGSKRGFIIRPKLGKPRVVLAESSAKRLGPWRSVVTLAARQALAGNTVAMHGQACRLTLSFVFPRPKSTPKRILHHVTKPDLDKCTRALHDALEGVLYLRDSQIVEEAIRKAYGDAPGVHVTFEVMQP